MPAELRVSTIQNPFLQQIPRFGRILHQLIPQLSQHYISLRLKLLRSFQPSSVFYVSLSLLIFLSVLV